MATITQDLRHAGEAVHHTATDFMREAAALSHAALESDAAEQLAHTVRLRLKRGRRAVENAIDTYEDAVRCVKRNPLLAVSVTLVSGVLLGMLAARSMGSARRAKPES